MFVHKSQTGHEQELDKFMLVEIKEPPRLSLLEQSKRGLFRFHQNLPISKNEDPPKISFALWISYLHEKVSPNVTRFAESLRIFTLHQKQS